MLTRSIAATATPPITREQHQAAVHRLQVEREKVSYYDFGNGPTPVLLGVIDFRDLEAVEGYPCVLEGYDRYGWPEGSPESPATA